MTLSELIAKLQELKDKYGDVEVILKEEGSDNPPNPKYDDGVCWI